MNTTINSVTFRDLPNTMLWWLKKTEFLPPRNKSIVPVQVTGPEYLSLKAVPEWERDAVANRIKDIVIPQFIDSNWTQNSLDKKINKLLRFLEQPQKYNPELKNKLETFVNVINNTK
jgi:predicted translin family RNA/ssDNA-binding protein